MTIRDMLRLGAMLNMNDMLVPTSQKLAEARAHVKGPQKASGKDRTKTKAARKQRRKQRKA